MNLLGIDLGTSSVKALLLDADERVIGTHSAPLTVERPQPGYSEQDPQAWWDATCACLDALRAAHPAALAAVGSIGLSGQMHGATLLDRGDRVLRPCMLWNDGRSSRECAELEAAFPELRAVAGNPAMPGFTAPKLLWVRRHEPRLFEKVAHVLLPKAWLRWKLTGEMIEDMSDASGTLWLDVGARRWSDAALAATGLERSQMPALAEGSDPAGAVLPALAQRWGFARAPLVAGSAGDNAAGAVGVGAVRAGDAFISLGTSGVFWVTTDRFRPRADLAVHAFCHALPATWHQMGVILSAAASLAWWAQVTGQGEAALLAEVGAAAAAGNGAAGPAHCAFIPYLSGERTPHNDTAVRGGFVNVGHETTRAQMTRAVLEGVAFAFRDAQGALRAAGTSVGSAGADLIGGGSRSALWAQVLADVLKLEMHQVEGSDAGCALGAARLGRMAASGDLRVGKPARLRSFAPDAARAARYDDAYAAWRLLYPCARDYARATAAGPGAP